MKTVNEIQDEIVEKFGFLPPFFSATTADPVMLGNLWQQTLFAYVNNPIPKLFKEKLATIMARKCFVPYCLVCHGCALRPLGMKSSEILELLETDFDVDVFDTGYAMSLFQDYNGPLGIWPSNTELEEELLRISILIAEGDRRFTMFDQELHRVLGDSNFDFLITFISYNIMVLRWVETHSEYISYFDDKRAKDNLFQIIEEEPKLANYFLNFRQW